jgi:hypothetical protein
MSDQGRETRRGKKRQEETRRDCRLTFVDARDAGGTEGALVLRHAQRHSALDHQWFNLATVQFALEMHGA